MSITGTLSASREVTNVVVQGYIDENIVGVDDIGDMEAGESVEFLIHGPVSVDSDSPTCSVDVQWVERS